MGKVGTAAKIVGSSAKVVIKYGPQAKIAWDNGGKNAAIKATRRARSLTARRKAFAHAATVVDGSVLKIAPGGTTAYVVFTGEQPIAIFPHREVPLMTLLAHVDLSKRVPADAQPKALGRGKK